MGLVDSKELNNILFSFFDAMKFAPKKETGGDYIVPIKGNQLNFYQDLIDYFDEEQCDKIIAGNSKSAYMEYQEKSHGVIIKYQLFQTSDIKWYSKISDWEKVKSFGLVRKTIIKKILVKNERKNAKKRMIEKEIITVENRYYISSKYVNIEEFNNATRGHWNIENKIHWHLDFTFAQDKNTTRNKKALLNLEITHKFVLGCLERVKGRYKKSLKLIRKHLSNNFEEFLYFECIDGFKKIFYNSILGIDSVKKSKIFSQKDSTG